MGPISTNRVILLLPTADISGAAPNQCSNRTLKCLGPKASRASLSINALDFVDPASFVGGVTVCLVLFERRH